MENCDDGYRTGCCARLEDTSGIEDGAIRRTLSMSERDYLWREFQ